MIFSETPLPGAFAIELEQQDDERGWFARTFSAEEFADVGLNPAVAHCNASYNARAGTLRGLHYQASPHAECKLVRCVRGAAYDVIVDLRPESPTFCQWFALELREGGGSMLYVPEGLAHGFQTLADHTELIYQMSTAYSPEHARGVRWDDPAFGIDWPDADRIIAAADRERADFRAPE